MRLEKGLVRASLFSAVGLFASSSLSAAPLWSDNSISLLQGNNHVDFYSESSEQSVITLEHVSGYVWGGVFFFIDRTEKQDVPAGVDSDTTYGEISPDLSLSYLTGYDFKIASIKDVQIATTYEFGGQMDNYLYGIGVDWDLPLFNRFSSKLYYVDNDFTKSDIQLTLTWGYSLPLESVEISFDGYLDWSSARSDHQNELHFNPQLLVNVSPYIGLTNSKLEIGFEYSYWHNKYGVAALTDESVFSLMAKYHL